MNNRWVVVDNTFMSPYLQQPLDLGADIVLHSVTKYIGGHSDVVMGALACNDDVIKEKLRFVQAWVGAVPSPFDCYLALRGLRTLPVRMDAAQRNALVVARFLEVNPAVDRVIYPGLDSHPGHEISKKQASGFGAMVTFYLKDGLEAASAFLNNLTVFTLAVSLGSVESLAESPALMTHSSVPPEKKVELGIDDNMIRLSIGIEDHDDLLEDLGDALLAATAAAAATGTASIPSNDTPPPSPSDDPTGDTSAGASRATAKEKKESFNAKLKAAAVATDADADAGALTAIDGGADVTASISAPAASSVSVGFGTDDNDDDGNIVGTAASSMSRLLVSDPASYLRSTVADMAANFNFNEDTSTSTMVSSQLRDVSISDDDVSDSRASGSTSGAGSSSSLSVAAIAKQESFRKALQLRAEAQAQAEMEAIVAAATTTVTAAGTGGATVSVAKPDSSNAIVFASSTTAPAAVSVSTTATKQYDNTLENKSQPVKSAPTLEELKALRASIMASAKNKN
jgi:hypothetical protein